MKGTSSHSQVNSAYVEDDGACSVGSASSCNGRIHTIPDSSVKTEANHKVGNGGIHQNTTDERTDLSSTGGISKRMRLVKTGFLICAGFAMGAPFSALGPAMLEMTELLDADFEQVSWGPTCLSVGFVIGCAIGGVLSDKFRPRTDVIIFACSVATGVSMGLVPWSPSLAVFYIIMFLCGVTMGGIRTASFAITNAMWGENPSTALHVLFAGITVGLMASPLLATPFLSEEYDVIGFTGNTSTVVSTSVDDPESIRYMFAIMGALMVVLSFPFLVFYLMGSLYSARKEAGLTIKETLSPYTYSPGRPLFGAVFTTIFFFIFTITYVHASIMNIFLFAMSVDDYGVSKKTSSSLLMVLYGIEVIGRLVFGAISRCVRIQIIVMTQLFVTMVFAVAFVAVDGKNGVILWGLSLSQQFFSGALYASYVPWGNRYVEFTGVVTSISQISVAGGFGIGAVISGALYEHHGQEALWYFWLACTASLVALTVPLQVVAARFGERNMAAKEKGDHVPSVGETTKL